MTFDILLDCLTLKILEGTNKGEEKQPDKYDAQIMYILEPQKLQVLTKKQSTSVHV
jgi:hypothetical protein